MADDLDHIDEDGEWSTVWGTDDVEDSDDTWPDDVLGTGMAAVSPTPTVTPTP